MDELKRIALELLEKYERSQNRGPGVDQSEIDDYRKRIEAASWPGAVMDVEKAVAGRKQRVQNVVDGLERARKVDRDGKAS